MDLTRCGLRPLSLMAEQPLRIGSKKLLTFGSSALLTLALTANIFAEELPKELVLQCQGNTELFVIRGNELISPH